MADDNAWLLRNYIDAYSIFRLIHERGTMEHNGSKRVLFISMDADKIAEKTGKDIKDVIRIINNGKEKLLREREKREAP